MFKKSLLRTVASCAAAFLLASALAACGGAASQETALAPARMVEMIASAAGELPEMNSLDFSSDEFTSYISDYYAIAPADIAGGALLYANGVEASEIAVLKVSDDADTTSVENALSAYATNRADAFRGYAPSQSTLAESAVTAVEGRYVVLVICPDTRSAIKAFNACFGSDSVDAPSPAPTNAQSPQPALQPVDKPSPTPTDAALPTPSPSPAPSATPVVTAPIEVEPVDEIDLEAVLEARRTGDASNLSTKNLILLAYCNDVLSDVITDDMTDYEKELAIHDWIIEWADYDEEVHSHNPSASPNPDNTNPFGLLVDKRAVCTGYSSTFQLFMDMLEIECITVDGYTGDNYEPHSWNMVKLDGEWYIVDVGWDDPSGWSEESVSHTFFNVTSSMLRMTEHHWDESAYPEATATKWKWVP